MLKREYDLEKSIQNLEGLYEKDPGQFEDLRREIINATINSLPAEYQQRARGIQFSLDCELNKYKHPVARMNRMVELFWAQVRDFQAVVRDPINYITEREEKKKAGKVIALF